MPDGLEPITSCSSHDPMIISQGCDLIQAKRDQGCVVQVHRFSSGGVVVQLAFPTSLAREFLELFLAANPALATTQAQPAVRIRRPSGERETCPNQILRFLRDAGRPLLPSELAELSQQQPIQYAERTITRTLAKLKRAGSVEQASAGQPYRLPNSR